MAEHVRRIRCPECDAELVVRAVDPADARGRGWWMEFPIYANGQEKPIGVLKWQVLVSGCPHADAWNRGPHDDGGGEPLPTEHLEAA